MRLGQTYGVQRVPSQVGKCFTPRYLFGPLSKYFKIMKLLQKLGAHFAYRVVFLEAKEIVQRIGVHALHSGVPHWHCKVPRHPPGVLPSPVLCAVSNS